MRYVPREKAEQAFSKVSALHTCGNIDKSGSVIGMQSRFGWPRGGQVRIGGYIYNPGPAGVQALRDANLIRGE